MRVCTDLFDAGPDEHDIHATYSKLVDYKKTIDDQSKTKIPLNEEVHKFK